MPLFADDSAASEDSEDGSEAADTDEEEEALSELKDRKAARNKKSRKKARVAAPSQGWSTKEDLVECTAEASEDEDLQRALALSLASPDPAGEEIVVIVCRKRAVCIRRR